MVVTGVTYFEITPNLVELKEFMIPTFPTFGGNNTYVYFYLVDITKHGNQILSILK